MLWVDKLEKRFGRWAIPNLTQYLLGLQLIGLVLTYSGTAALQDLFLISGKVLQGEWWRFFSFLMVPPQTNLLFLIFAFYLFYLMGSALEHQWGAFKYNLYVLIAYISTILCAFFVPYSAMSNMYIGGSIFLAFAYLFPDFELRLMFIMPVKVKWIAWFTWAGYGLALLTGGLAVKLSVFASVANFLLFFGRDLYLTIKARKRRAQYTAKVKYTEAQPLHVCKLCGVSDKADSTIDFRYCSTCKECFCSEHLTNHKHN